MSNNYSMVFELAQDGTMSRVETTRQQIKPTDQFFRAIACGQSQYVGNIGKIEDKQISVWGASPHCGASVQLSEINFHCAFRMNDKYYTPDFKANVNSVKMKLVWKIPANLHVRLGFMYTPFRPDGNDGGLDVYKCYLFALAPNNATYRLPLANVYDTSELCNGTFITNHKSVADGMKAVLDQFNGSIWNADLWSTITETDKMFRWEPKDDGMIQLPVENPLSWCLKVGVPQLKLLLP